MQRRRVDMAPSNSNKQIDYSVLRLLLHLVSDTRGHLDSLQKVPIPPVTHSGRLCCKAYRQQSDISTLQDTTYTHSLTRSLSQGLGLITCNVPLREIWNCDDRETQRLSGGHRDS